MESGPARALAKIVSSVGKHFLAAMIEKNPV